MERKTIVLTSRPPVTIIEDDWPIIARAYDKEHDGKVECQANLRSNWFMTVRQHADGRAIVYAKYTYSSNWEKSRQYLVRNGVLLPSDKSMDDVIDAINEVAGWMRAAECNGNDADRWNTIKSDCVADLPPEHI